MRTALRFALGLLAEGNYVWCLNIVVILCILDKQQQKAVGDALKSSIGVAMYAKRGGIIRKGVLIL